MKKFKLVLVTLVIALTVPSVSWAIGLEVAVGMWQQGPGGSFQYDGDELDLGDDFGISDKENLLMGRVKLDMPGLFPNIYLMGTQMSYEGEGSNTFIFGSYSFTTATETKLELDHLDVALYYGIPVVETASAGKLNIDLGLNVRFIDLTAEISELVTGHTESESLTVAIPMLYGSIQIRPTDGFGIEFEGRGLSIEGNSYFDAIARVKVSPMGPLFIAGGYRYEALSIDEDDTVIDITFEGPFVEAGFEF